MKLGTKILFFLTTSCTCILDAIIYNTDERQTPYKIHHEQQELDMVILTQKGYIQFLKYIKDVPAMTEYTFCIWLRSHNLTYSHPILSYSKHEEERLLRVWITPKGENISVEILNYPVGSVPVNIRENQWYHICQSWTSYEGKWSVYLNGKLASYGFAPQLKGSFIKHGGDIVIGQEYTDFDKGLDDGIEGDIFGFNFVLSPTSRLLEQHPNNRKHRQYQIHRKPLHPVKVYERPKKFIYRPLFVKISRSDDGLSNVGAIEDNDNNCITEMQPPRDSANGKPEENLQRRQFDYNSYRILPPLSSNYVEDQSKPLGLKLVELSFDCSYKKGAPFSGKDVLINWTKSQVRVFGGAVMKLISPNFCKLDQ